MLNSLSSAQTFFFKFATPSRTDKTARRKGEGARLQRDHLLARTRQITLYRAAGRTVLHVQANLRPIRQNIRQSCWDSAASERIRIPGF